MYNNSYTVMQGTLHIIIIHVQSFQNTINDNKKVYNNILYGNNTLFYMVGDVCVTMLELSKLTHSKCT